uniref:ADP-ribosylation factor-like protein 4A n=1 Tax=Anolis carolinensis TaxID=28377 RepID=A0A803T2R7_ANOCA|nr:PREDICTED: ADP-ribosylation factor-like protein 4A [Anolis carolinensis]|eukprot:XP_008110808.1 PREDICTED: ADP-ribosylation factor-like protein 4A [Anolis carolinensis]
MRLLGDGRVPLEAPRRLIAKVQRDPGGRRPRRVLTARFFPLFLISGRSLARPDGKETGRVCDWGSRGQKHQRRLEAAAAGSWCPLLASGPSPAMGNGLSEQTPILSSLPSFQCFHIVILGLDCAGKTTVLYRLQFNEFVNTVPTKGFNTEKIKVTLGNHKTVTFHFWDVGGQEKLRPLWKSYTRCTDGIVFVVDSVDVERMEEAKTELHKITRISENQGVPVLIVANKQDLRHSLSLSEMEKMLATSELSSSTPWHLQPTCAIIGDGLKEGLEKLHDMIIKRRKMLRQQKKKR